MAPKQKEGEYYIGDTSYLTMKSSTIIEMRDQLKLMIGDGRSVNLDVVIKADFDKISPEYHQLFCQMMMVRYGGIVNVWDNTQPLLNPILNLKSGIKSGSKNE